MKTFFTILLTAAIAVPATWYLTHRPTSGGAPATSTERPVLYYQSAMHPWIKSDKPGRCTICGMELTPVYEGSEAKHDRDDLVTLDPSTVRVINVGTAIVKKQPLTRALVVAGTLDDDASRHRVLSAYVDGRIEKLHVNHVGAEIVEGQPMASIYSQSLLVAESEYRMLDGRGRISATLRLKQMGLSPAQIAALPDKDPNALTSDISAPMTGTVVLQKVYEGQYVQKGDPLFEIADFTTMWFLFDAYETDLPWLRTGQTVEFRTHSLPGKVLEGKITFIDPNFDEVTRATKVRVEIDNPLVEGKRLLSHRVFGDGRVRMDAPDVLTVPRSAVIQTGPQAVVYVDQGGGTYQRREVLLGRRGDQLAEVISGVKDGEKVVTQGNLLIDGQAEINRSVAPPAEPTNTPAAITEAQRNALTRFLPMTDAMAAALAKDDLAAFNEAAKPAMEITSAVIEAWKDTPSPALAELEKHRHFHHTTTLKEARTKFHAFVMPAVDLLRPTQRASGSPAFHVWECPMVNEAVPGAPQKGRWIQTGDRPGNNPYFGKDMLTCGEELQP